MLLDRHFVSSDLLGKVTGYQAWVVLPFVLDHVPIILQLDGAYQQNCYPFKLNSGWLREEEFSRVVKEIWHDPKFIQEIDRQR